MTPETSRSPSESTTVRHVGSEPGDLILVIKDHLECAQALAKQGQLPFIDYLIGIALLNLTEERARSVS